MSTEVQTRPLTYRFGDAPEIDTEFWMDEITVDGIHSRKPHSIAGKPMITLKREFNEKGQPVDTGLEQNWAPDMEISDKHWMSCAAVVEIGIRCHECGEIAE